MGEPSTRAREFLTVFGRQHGGREGSAGARRRLLLEAQTTFSPTEFSALVEECYRAGDNAEKCSLLRALPELSEPATFLPLAVEACRTNVLVVFEAIACENPFVVEHFPEPNFNQVVLKALFLGVSLRRIVDLAARMNPELERMTKDFAAERRAAQRPVHEDVTWLLELESKAKGSR